MAPIRFAAVGAIGAAFASSGAVGAPGAASGAAVPGGDEAITTAGRPGREQCLFQVGAPRWARRPPQAKTANTAGPNWGCGLVGHLPDISKDGVASGETRRLIDGIKGSSDFNKATYWNWNVAPMKTDGREEYLSSDMIFIPEIWGVGPAPAHGPEAPRPAGQANFPDMMGGTSPAEMATILLGMNEPDIVGTCMGTMFGSCVNSCSQAALDAGDCPVARPDGPPAKANPWGECNCWEFSHPTGVGFWNQAGCAEPQPLPDLWKNPALSHQCVNIVMDAWKETVRVANLKGYKYLSTPLVAVYIGYARKFIEEACGCDASGQCQCTDASCGCPVYIGFHFYGNDCRPKSLDNYGGFRQKLEEVAKVMEDYPFVQGAIVNEVGMLNFAFNAIGEPGTGQYPAETQPGHTCPSTEELPNGMATFLEEIMELVINARTKDGREIIKGFSWFNQDSVGGTYNLLLQDANGNVNALGEAYIAKCTKWGQVRKAAAR
uniref:Asl1-like glycosyl hydrolase catalytic domain-containing protein n=1 Tax=Zooxanthella nutricula TaxID=1333877 RepID=A0A7S2KXJ1_9DINO